MATTTIKASVNAAIELRDKAVDNAYIAIGRTSAWDKETSPPQPGKRVDDLEEIVGFKKVENIYLVTPLSADSVEIENTVKFDGIVWEIVNDSEAVNKEAVYVYFSTTIDEEDFGTTEYRQVGLYLDTVSDSDNDTLLPEDVENNGDLYFISNRVPQIISQGIRVQEAFTISTLPSN